MKLEKIENTNIYEFKTSGKLTEKDAKNLTLSFEEFKRNGEKIKLLGTIEDFPSLESFSTLDDLLKLKMSSLKVVEKYAILSDKDWIENFVPVGNFFTPGLPVRAFELDDRKEAINWLKEEKVKEYKLEDYSSNINVKKIAFNTYEVNIEHKKINHAAMAALYDLFNNKKDGEKINVLTTFNSLPSIDSFKTIVEGLKIDFKAIGNIKKYAIVTDSKYIETYTKIGDFITPGLDMKFFHKAEIEDARNWVTSK